MVEDVILSFLEKRLEIPVCAVIPKPIPDRFVVIHKSGSARKNGIDTANIIAESYAVSRYQASQLNELVKTALDGLTELPEISRCQLSTDYPFPDTAIKKDRYQAVFFITYY